MGKKGARMSLSRRFHRHVLKREDGCWEWTGTRNQFGYGQLNLKPGTISAHRLAWEIIRGGYSSRTVRSTQVR